MLLPISNDEFTGVHATLLIPKDASVDGISGVEDASADESVGAEDASADGTVGVKDESTDRISGVEDANIGALVRFEELIASRGETDGEEA